MEGAARLLARSRVLYSSTSKIVWTGASVLARMKEEGRVPLTREAKAEIIERHRVNETDTGSADVQVAILTRRIAQVADHLKTNKHDFHTRRGLLQMVGQRRRLLKYLSRRNPERYQALIQSLGLRR